MNSLIRYTLISLFILVAAILNGCGVISQQTTGSTTAPATSSEMSQAEVLAFSFDVQETSVPSAYIVSFVITNTGNLPVVLTFPTSPVCYTYTIRDTSDRELRHYQDGVIDTISTITLTAGESYRRESFSYTKDTTAGPLTLTNTISFYLNGTLQQCSVSTTF